MSGKWIAIGAVVAILAIVGGMILLYYGTFNNLVALEESVDEKWAEVQQELQRRYDLIPRVVNASKLYIQYEGSILENITRLRSQWASALQTGDMETVDNATDQMESALSNLIVSVEAYPDLKASQVVQDLMVTLEGTENRISTERMRYNEATRDYNRARRSFPGSLWASGWGFEGREYFEAKIGAEEPPPVPID
ncbi:LemA family protein [Candidatus Bathyarchaeota archaeon]|nr:LemA family protein [Candidatus Bathyarchaeota archaeon]